MKVYMVGRGEYSDFRIVGIFSTLEKAEAFRKAFPAEGYSSDYHEPAEYEVDVPLPDPASQGLSYYFVQLNRNGDVVNQGVRGEGIDSLTEEIPEGMRWDWYKQKWNGMAYVDVPKEQWIGTFNVWARDKEHAVKVANDWRVQVLAREQPDNG